MNSAMRGYPLRMEGVSPYAGSEVLPYHSACFALFVPYKLIIALLFVWCNRYFMPKFTGMEPN